MFPVALFHVTCRFPRASVFIFPVSTWACVFVFLLWGIGLIAFYFQWIFKGFTSIVRNVGADFLLPEGYFSFGCFARYTWQMPTAEIFGAHLSDIND